MRSADRLLSGLTSAANEPAHEKIEPCTLATDRSVTTHALTAIAASIAASTKRSIVRWAEAKRGRKRIFSLTPMQFLVALVALVAAASACGMVRRADELYTHWYMR